MSTRIEMMLDAITIGDRIRGEYGDLSSLMASISELGLLQPIGVSVDGRLVFGGRRLEALRRLGHTTAAVRVISIAADAVTEMRAELDENIERAPLSPVEAAELRRRIRSHRGVPRAALIPDGQPEVVSAVDGVPTEVETAAEKPREDPAAVAIPATEPERAEERMTVIKNPAFDFDQPGHPAAEEAAPLAVAEFERAVQAATGYSTTTLKRVDRIHEFAASTDPDVAAAAEKALELIGNGAPVKPQLDKVIEIHAAAAATTKYPALDLIRSDLKHVLRMERFLDEILAARGQEAVDEEISTLESMWGDNEAITAASVSVEERERAYEFNSSLADVVNRWERGSASHTVSHVIPSLPDVAIRSWAALAKDLRAIADNITESIPDTRTSVGTR